MKFTSTHALIALAIIGILLLVGNSLREKESATTTTEVIQTANTTVEPKNYDVFTQCLKDSGAQFYGAFWCPHCQAQKELFGASAEQLPYIECSTPDKKAQTQVCMDAEIKGYPTWRFANGDELNGEVSLMTLSEKTNCTLP